MKEVNREEWAEFVSNFRTYHTETISGQKSIMYSRLSESEKRGQIIAEVHYSENAPPPILFERLNNENTI